MSENAFKSFAYRQVEAALEEVGFALDDAAQALDPLIEEGIAQLDDEGDQDTKPYIYFNDTHNHTKTMAMWEHAGKAKGWLT